MRLRHLRWLTVVVPLVFLAAVDVVRHLIWPELLHPWPGYLLVLAFVAVAVYLFSRAVFDHIEAMERRLVRQNRELRLAMETTRRQAEQLRALHDAGVALASDLSHEAVLQRVVDLARRLVNARYGALSVIDEQGTIIRFLTAGLTPEEQARLREPPKGRGLLRAIMTEGGPVLVDDIARDPRSVGFPPGHPTMTTFLGVPIVSRSRIVGNLYLTDKQGGSGPVPFTREDAEVVQLFAAAAGAAIENARLHAEVQALAAVEERERIARELHDSLAQVLGYIRLRVALARDALHRGAVEEVDQALGQIADAAGEAYADVREAILGLRTGLGGQRDLVSSLDEYLRRYRSQTGLEVEFAVEERARTARLVPGAEAQLLRIIQEALTNVRKHAQATRVTVRLDLVVDARGQRLRAAVRDNGRGFALDRLPGGAHFGLATMRERAEEAGGIFSIASQPGAGTEVAVEMPLEAAPDAAAVTTEGG